MRGGGKGVGEKRGKMGVGNKDFVLGIVYGLGEGI